MPREITNLSPRKGRPAKYDWDSMLVIDQPLAFEQGSTEEVEAGLADFDCEAGSFATQIRAAADARGLKVSLRNPSEGVVESLAYVPADDDEDSNDA